MLIENRESVVEDRGGGAVSSATFKKRDGGEEGEGSLFVQREK